MAYEGFLQFKVGEDTHKLSFSACDFPSTCGVVVLGYFNHTINGYPPGAGTWPVKEEDLNKILLPEVIEAAKTVWDDWCDRNKTTPRTGTGGWPDNCGVFLACTLTDANIRYAKFLTATGWVEAGAGKNYANNLRLLTYTWRKKEGTVERLQAPEPAPAIVVEEAAPTENTTTLKVAKPRAKKPAYVVNDKELAKGLVAKRLVK